MARLRAIPNIGPKMAAELIKLGVMRLEDAVGRDPDEMYIELCAIDAKRHDPCVRDIFAAVVSYAEGGPARPWWEFTPERKAQELAREEEGLR
jgi:Pathogenicity locus